MTSKRQSVIIKCRKLLLQIVKIERGEMCEICGKTANLGLFHILPVGRYPRIQLYKQNVLIAGWYCCHFKWHHDFFKARDIIAPRIIELRGENYEEDLIKQDAIAPKLSLAYLQILHAALAVELKSLSQT